MNNKINDHILVKSLVLLVFVSKLGYILQWHSIGSNFLKLLFKKLITAPFFNLKYYFYLLCDVV